ncbi:nucleotide-binding domain-containing protein [Mycena vulgaris]|nr:nucleotide-binding domain-containing protein [Mycena vulgaris]
MGSTVSRLRLIYQTLKSISDSFSALSERISRDPGLPIPYPSRSYWLEPPSPLDNDPLESKEGQSLPAYADVVIIGSGIAGTAIARTLLSSSSMPLRVVMLEARDVCSGATGRNGGHISPNSYQDYSQLERTYGAGAAQAIIRFRLAHLPALLKVAEEEDLLRESQARTVSQFDVYLQDTLFGRAKEALAVYLNALPENHGRHTTHEDKAALQHDFQLSPRVTGCVSQPGGALHPYRLITGILSRLLAAHPKFDLFTHTPCTAIVSPGHGGNYVLTTPKGTITAAHVIHATNAWASHLLPGLRRTIVPMRVHMTTQRPGCALGARWAGTRAFVFYPGTSMAAFDYLTQQPCPAHDDSTDWKDTGYPPPAGELMFGGGAMLGGRAESAALDNIGISDDSQDDFEVSAYLGGALERYFAAGWGGEGGPVEEQDTGSETRGGEWGQGRMRAAWTGIMGLSADGQPWVGRVPSPITQRAEPALADAEHLARPGEWIAAGFTGEGMTHAWLAGVALARMVLGPSGTVQNSHSTDAAAELPPQFLITEKRWRAADIEAFLGDVGDA